MTDYTLAMEGSTYAGSVALLLGKEVIVERTLVDSGIPTRDGREERVLPSVVECLSDASVRVSDIARIVCGAGPGSFTSLRISASVAKGIAVGVGCPMFSVPSLVLSAACVDSGLEAGRYLSVLPAMRDEWFASLIEVGDGESMDLRCETFIIPDAGLGRTAVAMEARLLGPGKEIESRPHARGVSRLLELIISGGQVAIETWEPDYGRLAEAQVRWEAAHGRPLVAGA